MSCEIDYTVRQGDDLYIDIMPVDEDGDGYDFAGATVIVGVEWQGGRYTDDTTGGVTAENGVITAMIPKTVTAQFPRRGRVDYQIQVIDTAGVTSTIYAGRIEVLNAATS